MSQEEMDVRRFCDLVRVCGYEAHCYLKHGHLEKIYEKSLANRLRSLGLSVEQQFALPVYDEDGSLLGDFYADLFIENRLIVELKACRAITPEHVAQLIGYLRTSRIEHGLLINFGAPVFYIKKYILSQKN